MYSILEPLQVVFKQDVQSLNLWSKDLSSYIRTLLDYEKKKLLSWYLFWLVSFLSACQLHDFFKCDGR